MIGSLHSLLLRFPKILRSESYIKSVSNSHRKFTSSPKRELKIGIQGAGFDRGQPKDGVDTGPKIIRNSGFKTVFREIGHDVLDYGDISFNLGLRKPQTDGLSLKNVAEVATANLSISQNTSKILRDGRICLTLGGDHSIGIGTIHGASEVHNDLAVLWVDAHADINTVGSTTSGNLHGMSMAFLLKELSSEMSSLSSDFSWCTPRISASNIAYIGLRSVDPGERETLDRLGITTFSMGDIDRIGILEVTSRALEKITSGGKRSLHLSFDIDAINDMEIGCATGTPEAGGLTLREGITILEETHKLANIVSMDLVEVNSFLSNPAGTQRIAAASRNLLCAAFGYDRGGYRKSK